MRKIVVWLVVMAFLGAGCASKEQWADYHSSIDKQTAALLKFSEAQANAKAKARAEMMVHYSTAMTTAAVTPSPTDDTLLAFAWGVQVATPDPIVQPSLPKVVPPDKTSDLWRAATPFVGMVMPFLYAIPWANNSGSGGTTIAADNGASVNLHSGNPGSYNTAGGDLSSTSTMSDAFKVENCDGCDTGEGGPGTDVDPTNPIEGGETCEESGGYLGPDGRIYADPGFTCSCGSRAGGVC